MDDRHRNQLGLEFDPKLSQPASDLSYKDLLPLKVTPVFAAYWKFATERQAIYYRRLAGLAGPWTTDPILKAHKFTNVYRAADRVSQYLIRHVIYEGAQTSDELFFRIMVFKMFNRIDTWLLLVSHLRRISWASYEFTRYDEVLTKAMATGVRIYSAAYIMPSGKGTFGHDRKHSNHLKLIELMLHEEVPARLQQCKTMRAAFELLKSYPMLGDFLAYQLVTDLNYSTLTDFSETEFVVAGPGAQDGITKCFSETAGLSCEEIIVFLQRRQDTEFARHGLHFQRLGDRPLQLIDCQNIFCEISKYARVAFPDQKGVSNRHRIKQKFSPLLDSPLPWFPPKWEINQYFSMGVKPDVSDHRRQRR